MSEELIIPYAHTSRPDTGIDNVKLGMWLFLASEVMLFGALFSSYIILRVGSSEWPFGVTLNIPMATANTIVLIASSITMVLAWAYLKKGSFSKHQLFLLLTILLGITFLVIKSIEYSEKFHHGMFPKGNTFLALYFALTGLHVVHLIIGLGVNIFHLASGKRVMRWDKVRFSKRIEVSGLYWHFVDLVWIFLFPVLYLI